MCLHVDVYGRLCAVKRSREERTGEEENEDRRGRGGRGGGGEGREGNGDVDEDEDEDEERARAALLRSEKETRIESRSESWLRSHKEVDTR